MGSSRVELFQAIRRLVDEHGMEQLTYSTVRDYVARRRPQIAAEAGRSVPVGFVLQDHPPGAEAEVDFGHVWVQLAGVSTRCFLFTFRLSHSGMAVHRVFASQGQEAFIEGHQAAFRVLGGVPTDKIRYDNLRSAVSRVLSRHRPGDTRTGAARADDAPPAWDDRTGRRSGRGPAGPRPGGGHPRRAQRPPRTAAGSTASPAATPEEIGPDG